MQRECPLTHAPEVPESGRFLITPERAQQWLDRYNKRNRNPKLSHIRTLSGVMSRKEWRYNGEPISFSAEGNLMNGQHRLLGCVHSGVCIDTRVEIGLDPDVFGTLDKHSQRTNADVLSILGEKNTFILAATLAWIWRWENGDFLIPETPSESQLQDVFKRHPTVHDSVDRTKSVFLRRGGGASVATFIHYIANEQSENKARVFFDRLIDGIGLNGDSPIRLLRERILSNAASKAKLSPGHVLALYIKAWSSFRDGRPMLSLRWRQDGDRPEPFPKL